MARNTDGHKTLLEFDLAPFIKFWTKDLIPPGLDGGGANDITVMENDLLRTMYPKKLYTLTDTMITVQYDPVVYDTIITSLINKNGILRLTFPDTAQLLYWGWLNSFKPTANKEGEPPTAEVQVIASNVTDDDPPVEVLPVYIA